MRLARALATLPAEILEWRRAYLAGIPRCVMPDVLAELSSVEEREGMDAGTRYLLSQWQRWQSAPAGSIELGNLLADHGRVIGREGVRFDSIAEVASEARHAAKVLIDQAGEEATAEMLGQEFAIRYPEPGRQNVTWEGIGQRLTDTAYWRRQLSRQHLRRLEAGQVKKGRVRRGRQAYVSDEALSMLKARWQGQEEALQHALALSDQGDEVSMADMFAGSVANPRVRFAELMTRIKGTEAIAQECGHEAVFVTLTCPSRYHPTASKRTRAKKGQRRTITIDNRKWDGSTPRDAQDYLCRLWGLVRSAADRRGLTVYGMRIAEPHADGCPHWHLCVWGEPQTLAMFLALFQSYAVREDRAELGNDTTPRFTWERIDPAKGSAVAYVTKYLTKNIDGKSETRRDDGTHAAMGEDFETGADTITAADRVRAWASVHGIRQFQFYQSAPVGVWRELRKLRGADSECPWIDWATEAADKGDWALFVRIMGGPLAKRADRKVTLAKDAAPGRVNRYGEEVGAVVRGVQSGAAQAITRIKTWRIEWAKSRRGRGGAAAPGAPAPAWTRVNNCTQPEGEANANPARFERPHRPHDRNPLEFGHRGSGADVQGGPRRIGRPEGEQFQRAAGC